MTFRGRLAVLWCSVAVAALLVVVMAATDAEPAGDLVVTEAGGAAVAQPSTTDGGPTEPETEVGGKVVQRPPEKDVPTLPDITEMPRTGTSVLVRRLAIGLLLLGVGLLVIDHTMRDHTARGR